jgi:DNA-directed RNA polymerase specialized sigma24 family protein
MMTASDLRLLDVDQLADECADHTERFFNRLEHDTSYCYELFRRAIVGRNSYAWEKIYCQYQPLVVNWVKCRGDHPAVMEEVDYFVNCAFEKMWSAIDAKKFGRFDDLASLLRYLQTCVHSVIVDYTRSTHLPTVSLEAFPHPPPQDLPSIEKRVTERLEGRRLWQTVVGLIRDEKESIILRGSFLYGLRPSEIYDANPDQFESLDELYQIKRNLLNRLRRHPRVQQFLDQ